MSQEKAPLPMPDKKLPLSGPRVVSESFLPLPAGSEGGVDGWFVMTTMELPVEPKDAPANLEADIDNIGTDK